VGKEIVKQDSSDSMMDFMFQGLMMVVVLLVVIPLLPVAQSAKRYYDSMVYEGRTEPPFMFNCVEQIQHLDIKNPWVTAYFTNMGEDYDALVSLNGPDNPANTFIVRPKEVIWINRLGAKERIYSIDYSSPHNTILRVLGEY